MLFHFEIIAKVNVVTVFIIIIKVFDFYCIIKIFFFSFCVLGMNQYDLFKKSQKNMKNVAIIKVDKLYISAWTNDYNLNCET